MITAVIIDDNAEARTNLKSDLADSFPDLQIIGEGESVVSGTKLLKQVKPQIVFLDIQLGDGSGFDLLEILGDVNFNVIFTTASDEYAVKAFRFSAIDYLLKPIDPDQLKSAVEKAVNNGKTSKESLDLLMEHSKNNNKPHKRLALNTLDKIHIVNITDIVRCEADVNYTTFYFTDKSKLLVTRTLKEFEDLLKDHSFLRVHQSHLVNTNLVKEFVKGDGGYLVMNDASNVPVSTRKRNAVVEALNSL
ncbi:MAG: LytTR family DNA-binding domain-containing protein [Flavobacteriales bacterium]|nr:LytTR family DNA-binding domain-containing protein [Flavobacteriales bacterium]